MWNEVVDSETIADILLGRNAVHLRQITVDAFAIDPLDQVLGRYDTNEIATALLEENLDVSVFCFYRWDMR